MKPYKIMMASMMSAIGVAVASCDDYLDITPPSSIAPESYFTKAEQLGAYTLSYYTGDDNQGSRDANAFPSFGCGTGIWGGTEYLEGDLGTDNEGSTDDRFFDGAKKKVGTSGGDWSFSSINAINYFLEQAQSRYKAGQISGDETQVRHYIGEGYVLRAIEYSKKLRKLGDFPIITECLPLDRPVLEAKSRRYPRNKVARFILSDLDSALALLSDGSSTGGRNRITRDVALMEKARIALYEATFEKYFAGTPFVPDKAAGWPGAKMAYNSDFTYSNSTEVDFFLDQAMAAAKELAEKHPSLTQNNKKVLGSTYDKMPLNPYYNLFAGIDPSGYDEALMYRTYANNLAGHCFSNHIAKGSGYTQEFANCFLMTNGLPIYAQNSGYAGDDFVADTKKNRDYRWQLFMKAPGDYVYEGVAERQIGVKNTGYVVPTVYSEGNFNTSTGYHKSKGWSTNNSYTGVGSDLTSAIIYRVAEAYLVYMEAAWEKYGDGLDPLAWELWGRLRERAGLPADANVTIAATDLDSEEEYTHDFALYSAGKRIQSKVLYNIRRERRCELMSEGFRMDDLIRWRALDQLKGKHFFKHGAKIFGPMLEKYPKNKLKYDQTDVKKNNVSSPSDVDGGFNGNPEYLSLLRVSSASEWYESGYSWRMAHYLNPIAESHFLESVSGGDISASNIYQNPYWSTTKDTPAEN